MKLFEKSLLCTILMIVFTSTNAFSLQEIDLNMHNVEIKEVEHIKESEFEELRILINQYSIVRDFAREYNSMSFTLDNETIIIELDKNIGITQLRSISKDEEFETDLNIRLSRDEVIYLLENYHTMDRFEIIKFILRSEMRLRDILTISSIALQFYVNSGVGGLN